MTYDPTRIAASLREIADSLEYSPHTQEAQTKHALYALARDVERGSKADDRGALALAYRALHYVAEFLLPSSRTDAGREMDRDPMKCAAAIVGAVRAQEQLREGELASIGFKVRRLEVELRGAELRASGCAWQKDEVAFVEVCQRILARVQQLPVEKSMVVTEDRGYQVVAMLQASQVLDVLHELHLEASARAANPEIVIEGPPSPLARKLRPLPGGQVVADLTYHDLWPKGSRAGWRAKPGDVVRKTSGGPLMTVESVDRSRDLHVPVHVSFFVQRMLVRLSIDEAELEPVAKDEVERESKQHRDALGHAVDRIQAASQGIERRLLQREYRSEVEVFQRGPLEGFQDCERIVREQLAELPPVPATVAEDPRA